MSCCSAKPATKPTATTISDEEIVKVVTESYGARALTAGTDQEYAQSVASAFGYTAEELQAIPAEANMGLSCGNPTGIANLKEGERVLDLGSGGGIDIFLAAAKVGPTGQAIGLDGSTEMIALARRNAASKKLTPPRVAFVHANLEKELPIEDNSIDCVISNCVINLLPTAGKKHIFKEVSRVLKPGGRVVISDLVAKKPLPEKVKSDLVAYVNCIAGAVTEEEYRQHMADAGFKDILFVDKKSDLSIYFQDDRSGGCCTGVEDKIDSNRPQKPDIDMDEWIASCEIYALKPKTDAEVTIPETSLKRWWDAYPAVQSTPPSLTNDEVAALVRSGDKDFVVVDGGHVRGSEQWPAQTFYDELPALHEKHKDTKKVIFYCQSSNGRGPRCAGWYQDYLNKQGVDGSTSQAYVLQGGIKGWLAKFQDQEDLVDRD
ncbi:arsenite S-adenosylmethyltransferase [Coprinopsis cinerea okayama7|uniref:Arsenite methyltransferase n=1 Tax=Coprinopsis cinerea (strain Okayama-7 / 130 / ATCC MYA-4618 / FGSC 9003) TaxID=240176 RepID=A8NE85_COPC7|nr:arsenite S-adenosylmethyltransferase [Coprinopsis cinerea okayama7\|eukprot:XP_001832959.2 arsenite S-adenosylmethyltransferase [Coprinopsis cinerea okayama7\